MEAVLTRPGERAGARWSAAARVLAGTLGAYGLASLATVALALVLAALGFDRVEAVYTAQLLSFALFALIAIAVFHARNIVWTWVCLVGAAVPLALLNWWLMPGGAV